MAGRIKELDALRGIAALLVVFFHFTMHRPEYNYFFKLGTTGVDLFFMISGFVIFMSLGHITRGSQFVINRASRLYPTYWASVTFTFMIIACHSLFLGNFKPGPDLVQYAGNLTMFQFYLGIPDLDGPYWTMIIEMLFYMAIWLLYVTRSLRFIDSFCMAASSAAVVSTLFFWDHDLVRKMIIAIPLFQFIPLFYAGITFYRIFNSTLSPTRGYSLLVFCLACQILLFNHAGRSHKFISHGEYAAVLAFYFLAFVLFLNGGLRFVSNKVLLFFGKISFALYLTHQYLSLYVVIPFFHGYLGLGFWPTSLFITLPIAIGVAALITYYVEIPYSRKMKEQLRLLEGRLRG
jgi:peptidoglycan/LPS O-acetylase OafA/YrhL